MEQREPKKKRFFTVAKRRLIIKKYEAAEYGFKKHVLRRFGVQLSHLRFWRKKFAEAREARESK